ncbi:hypothetical protein HJC23_002516 [Cyclotella cryptica]|uniref:MOCS2A n=1 Tax=Cyclotella cryptica TaxID=29204 RepID=A0ABD3QVX8_9STRA
MTLNPASPRPPPSTITIEVLFFASAREAAGVPSTSLSFESTDNDGSFNTKMLRTKLASNYPKLAALVQDEESITLAVNEEYVPYGENWELKDGDTVALIPPISGG